MVWLLPKKLRSQTHIRKDIRKDTFYICGKQQKRGLFQHHQCFCVILMWRRINTACPGSLGFGLSKKKAKPALSPPRVTDCFLLPLSPWPLLLLREGEIQISGAPLQCCQAAVQCCSEIRKEIWQEATPHLGCQEKYHLWGHAIHEDIFISVLSVYFSVAVSVEDVWSCSCKTHLERIRSFFSTSLLHFGFPSFLPHLAKLAGSGRFAGWRKSLFRLQQGTEMLQPWLLL